MRPRGAFVIAVLALGLWLFAPGSAAAQGVPCLTCDPTGDCCPTDGFLDAPCTEFFACQDANHAAIEDCVSSQCKVPARYAICSAALSCSRRCAARDGTNCSVNLRTALQTAGSCSIGRGTARRACNRCIDGGGSRVCSDLMKDTSGSSCQRDCIRQQPWIQECYAKCDDRCADDRCAIALCRRSCRDSICQILQNTCSLEGPAQSSLHPVQQQLRRQYKRCCDAGGCEEDDESTVACESTTTTSTSSTTSSSSSTTTVQGSTTTTSLRTSTTLP
jgi:hypothetical protein